MSVQNPDRIVTKQDLKDFYDSILPYLGGVSSAGFTPVGTIIAVMGVNAPANYLKCDGTVYNISSYIELSNYFKQQFGSKNYFGGDGTTTFAVPDLRGEFLRGTGTNSHSGQGNGASVGTHQDSTTIPIISSWPGTTPNTGVLSDSDAELSITNEDGLIKKGAGTTRWSQYKGTVGTTGLAGDSKNIRPTNTSVLYCIATKNIYLNPSLDYSTEERIIGTWIDGKPIYQKTMFVQTASSTTSGTDTITDAGVVDNNTKFIISITGRATDSITDGHSFSFPGIFNAGDNRVLKAEYIPTTKKISIYNSIGRSINEIYLTIQYTKTTD